MAVLGRDETLSRLSDQFEPMRPLHSKQFHRLSTCLLPPYG